MLVIKMWKNWIPDTLLLKCNNFLQFLGLQPVPGQVPTEAEVALKKSIFRDFSLSYDVRDGLKLRKLKLVVDAKDPTCKIQKLSLGRVSAHRQTKVIMLLGETGTGKTTLINAMVNFIFRVEFEDDWRLLLVDNCDAPKRYSESQTDFITAYVFNYLSGMPYECNYILIDTPGFGDTRGIWRDREMITQLESFLKQDYGIDKVDAVGFVTPASVARLTCTQRYIFDCFSLMFGKDIKENIHIMATFADAKEPPVVAALKDAEVPYSGFYKFNNSAIYANNSGSSKNQATSQIGDAAYINRQYWEMGNSSLDDFFLKLVKTIPTSFTLTQEVLEERRKLQTIVVGLQNQIQHSLSQLANLHQERDMLLRISNDIEGCNNYEEEVVEQRIIKVRLKLNECVTNCTKCNLTCHFPCGLSIYSDKKRCRAMRNGICEVCPGKCDWIMHDHMEFRFDTKCTKVKRTVQELFNRYNLAVNNQKDKLLLVKKMEDDIGSLAKCLIDAIKKAQNHVERLEEIALKSNPISTKEYIELLIEGEKMQKRPNFMKTIKMLEMLKREEAVIAGVRGADEVACSGAESLLNHFRNLFSGN